MSSTFRKGARCWYTVIWSGKIQGEMPPTGPFRGENKAEEKLKKWIEKRPVTAQAHQVCVDGPYYTKNQAKDFSGQLEVGSARLPVRGDGRSEW